MHSSYEVSGVSLPIVECYAVCKVQTKVCGYISALSSGYISHKTIPVLLFGLTLMYTSQHADLFWIYNINTLSLCDLLCVSLSVIILWNCFVEKADNQILGLNLSMWCGDCYHRVYNWHKWPQHLMQWRSSKRSSSTILHELKISKLCQSEAWCIVNYILLQTGSYALQERKQSSPRQMT